MSEQTADPQTPRMTALAKDERHLTHAETVYWLNQYKQAAFELERESIMARTYLVEANRKLSAAQAALKEASKGAALQRAVFRACEELPEGMEICLSMENGAAWVTWVNKDGDGHSIDGAGDTLAEQINQATDAALADTRGEG